MFFTRLFEMLRGDVPSYSEEPGATVPDASYTEHLSPLTQLYFFGSFNPVHEGHLHVARHALATLSPQGMREVIFIPSAFPPNKKHGIATGAYPLMSMAERLFRLQRTIAAEGAEHNFKVLALERYAEHQESPCFTATTLKRHFHPWLQAGLVHPPRFHLLMGEETFISLSSWQQLPWLIAHCHFIVFPRPTHRGGEGSNTEQTFEAVYQQSSLKKYMPVFTYLNHIPAHPASATRLRTHDEIKPVR
jgi:nicotinate (nicotinamide) nucleotide adenylyltransferase